MDIFPRWWIRRCRTCLTRNRSRQTIRLSIFSLRLPNGQGTTVSVAYVGPISLTPRGNAYISIFTNQFSDRAAMHAVTGAEFTAAGTTDILVDLYIPLSGLLVTVTSRSGLPVFLSSRTPYLHAGWYQ